MIQKNIARFEMNRAIIAYVYKIIIKFCITL